MSLTELFDELLLELGTSFCATFMIAFQHEVFLVLYFRRVALVERFISNPIPWQLILGVFVLATLDASLNYPLAFGESQTLVYAKQFAIPTYVEGDWFLSQRQLTRNPYQLLVYPLVVTFPLPIVSFLSRLVGYLVVAAGIGMMCRQLKISAVKAWIGFGVFLILGQASLPGQEWIIGGAESKVIAYGLILCALGLLMQRRLWSAGAAAGLATTFHILVGFWATLAIAIVVLVEEIGSGRERLKATFWWILGASFALYALFDRVTSIAAPMGVDVTDIWVNFRNPHYTQQARWGWDEPVTVAYFLGFIAILVFARKARRDSIAFRVTTGFGLATLLPFLVTVLASKTPYGEVVAFYMPFRVADTLLPLTACILGAGLFFDVVIQPRAQIWVASAALLVVFASAGENFMEGLEHSQLAPKGGMTGSYSRSNSLWEMCDFIRGQTPSDALIITAPDEDLINYACERSVIVTFRNVPSSSERIAEWYQRLVHLNGLREPRRNGYSASREISENFQNLPDVYYEALGDFYGGRYLLLRSGSSSNLTRIFSNAHYQVFLLGESKN